MVRMFSIAAAAATLFAAVPAVAQAPAFRAIPATPAKAAQNVVVGETLWKCAPDGCTTTKSASRPAILCAQAVKKVGKLDSFVVGGVAFDADALAKCNAKAKDGATAFARN
jgi:hypothetical protein